MNRYLTQYSERITPRTGRNKVIKKEASTLPQPHYYTQKIYTYNGDVNY